VRAEREHRRPDLLMPALVLRELGFPDLEEEADAFVRFMRAQPPFLSSVHLHFKYQKSKGAVNINNIHDAALIGSIARSPHCKRFISPGD